MCSFFPHISTFYRPDLHLPGHSQNEKIVSSIVLNRISSRRNLENLRLITYQPISYQWSLSIPLVGFEHIFGQWALIQPVFTFSKSRMQTSEQCVKSIQS